MRDLAPQVSRELETIANQWIYVTGSVRVDPLFQPNAPARVSGALLTFQPKARSAWHSHPLGQTLIVTAGIGLVQRWGSPIDEIREGDVVWIPPNHKHWHGASPGASMSHIAIVEQLNGKSTDWMEKVSDAQYAQPVRARASPAARTDPMNRHDRSGLTSPRPLTLVRPRAN